MKGKLIKIEDKGYYNFEDHKGNLIATSYKFKNPDSTYLKKLSLKNCESIERGYDLDELAYGYDLYEKGNFVGQMRTYKEGFNKAMELNKDKLFTVEDMINFSEFVSGKYINQHKFLRDKSLKGFFTTAEILKEYQSLKQTEWDVEIVMACVIGCENLILNGENSLCCGNKKPKLDEDGCLILKKI